MSKSLTALRWLRDHHFYLRGHNLVWPGKEPVLARPPGQREAPARHARRQGEISRPRAGPYPRHHSATRGLIDEWDVMNEPFDHHALMDLFGPGIMADWFRAAQAGAPGVPLYLNDWGNQDFRPIRPTPGTPMTRLPSY